MPQKTKITIDDLAKMIKGGFDGVDKKFEKVDERFEKIDERFEKIDERFEKIDERFEKIDERFAEIDMEIKKMGGEIRTMGKDAKGTEARLMVAIKGEKEKRTAFNVKIIEVLKRNGLIEKHEVDYLEVMN